MFIGMATAEALILRPTNAKSQLIGKDLNAGKDRRERTGQQRMRRLDGITDSTDMGLSKPWDIVRDTGTWWVAVHGAAKSRTRLSD